MFSFFSGKNRSLGIDIGTTGIKVVELKKENNTPVLVNYAISSYASSGGLNNGAEISDDQMSRMLKDVLKQGEFSANRSVMGIPGYLALISFMEIPEMPQGDIDQAVRFEAGKYIPTPLEEVSLGWEIIGTHSEKPLEGGQVSGQTRKMQIMVVTVPRSAVQKLSTIARLSRLNLAALEVENFAAVRCLVGNDKGTFMIVNVGARTADFTVVSDSVIRVTRSIDVGGVEISRAIASGLGIDIGQAEKMKKSTRINLLDSRDRLSGLVNPTIGLIADEIKRLREIFHKKNPLRKIDKLLFTGGTSKIPTLTEYFARETSAACQIGNSLARVVVEKKHQKIFEEVAPELTVAIGLALRGFDGK